MSVPVETPKAEEQVPVTKPVESTSTPAPDTVPATSEPVINTDTGPMGTMEPEITSEATKTDAVVEATPASEGVLSYKAPGLLK